MFFALTDEQRSLAETVRDYLADRFDLTAVRGVFEAPDSDGNPADLWKAVGEQGWLAVLVPEEHDGLGLGLLDAQVVARAFGAGVVPGPWLTTVLAGEAIRLAGSAEQTARLLPRIAAGETVATVALRATGASYGISGVGVTATADGVLTLPELLALPSAVIGTANQYTETDIFGISGPLGAGRGMYKITARGTLPNGHAFSLHVNEVLGELRVVEIKF